MWNLKQIVELENQTIRHINLLLRAREPPTLELGPPCGRLQPTRSCCGDGQPRPRWRRRVANCARAPSRGRTGGWDREGGFRAVRDRTPIRARLAKAAAALHSPMPAVHK